jgi:hypothetical protein
MIKYNFKKINGENNLEIEGTHHHEWTSRLRFDRPHSSCRDEARFVRTTPRSARAQQVGSTDRGAL